jgi:hypothetical protein
VTLVTFRGVAAALCIAATIVAVGLMVLRPDAGAGAPAADAQLQVIPRGPGTVTSSAPDKTTGETSCTKRSEPVSCNWVFTQGATVVLTAVPNGTDARFAGWSTPDCPGTNAMCRVTVDDDQSISALFSKLTLRVDLSGHNDDERVTSEPSGIDCPSRCEAKFDARSTVRLRVNPGKSKLNGFPFGCTSVEGNVCVVTMLDEPHRVGVRFNDAQGPDPPNLVQVAVRVRKTGDGTGRVTAAGLDCGGTCLARFEYGRLELFSVAAERGSIFDGWGGICASEREPRCRLPIGPITLIRPKFVKEAPPSAPGALNMSSATETSITFAWGASTDDTGVAKYDVFVGGEATPRLSTTTPTAIVAGLACGTEYEVAVQAVDAADNRSTKTSARLSTALCPLRVQFLKAKVVRSKAVRRLVMQLKSTVSTRGSGTFFVGGKQIARTGVVLRTGTNAIGFRMPRGTGLRRVRVLLRLADPGGGAKTLNFRMTVRT